MGKRAPYLSDYFLLDRGDDFGSGMEDQQEALDLLNTTELRILKVIFMVCS